MPETPLADIPVGTVRIKKRTIAKQYVRQERFVKVSHHGKDWRKRWRPFAWHWWTTHVGPIPPGYRVFHRDGNSLNDDPANLVLCREDRFRLIFAVNPDAMRKRQRKQARAVARSNRRRGRVFRSQIKATAWYLVLPQSRAIVWQPCRSRLAASRLVNHDTLAALCAKDFVRLVGNKGKPYAAADRVEVVRGDDLQRGSQNDGPFEGFIRLIPDVRRAPRKRGAKVQDNLVELLRAG